MNRYRRLPLGTARLTRLLARDPDLRSIIRWRDVRNWHLAYYRSIARAADLRARRRGIANDIGAEVFG